MPLSGSNDFDQTAATIIKDALLLCSGIEDDETPSDGQYTHALRALNRMCKAWSVKGLKAWCWKEASLPLVASTASYTLGQSGDLAIDRPLEVSNPRKVISGQETPIRVISRQEYQDQPSKETTGEPIAVYYDPQLTNGVLYVWPAPAGTYTIKFDYRQYIEDFDGQSNNPYFPQEWLEAIIYGLAYRLCPRYEVTGEDRNVLLMQAKEFLMEAEDSDREQGSLFISPNNYG